MGVNTGAVIKPYWGNGHYYLFTKEGASWYDAMTRSNVTLTQLNSTGYLATVTSAEENSFIYNYSYNGNKIPNSGFLAGTDDNGQGTSEGTWLWKSGPENGSVFRSSNTNRLYTNWAGGEPNNSGNEDFLHMKPDGYWNDNDPDSVNGYITEWGRSGSQYSISFSGNAPTNAYENGASGSFKIQLDNKVYSDYVNINTNKALIDIPITFGGSAVYDIDYTVSVTANGSAVNGTSYDRNAGRLYLLGSSTVTGYNEFNVTINPLNDSTWRAPRDVTISLGADGSENIYSLSGSTSKRLWIYDDEPTLSLGQGLYQSIYTNYFSTGSSGSLPSTPDTTLFDANGINEADGTFDDYGLYDNFGVRWEGYIRIPDTGTYVFKPSTDDGVRLTLRRNNSSGTQLDSINQWVDQSTTLSGQTLSLSKGDVVWMQMDYYENGGGATAALRWDRTPSGGSTVNEIIPASALFLSEDVARGRDRTEPDTADSTATAFTLFANKSYPTLNLQFTSSTGSGGNTTINSTYAQQRTQSESKTGDDYALYSDAATQNLLGANPSFTWEPKSGALSRDIYVKTFTDLYAENTEQVQLSLANNTQSNYANYGIASASQSINIFDQDVVLAVTGVQNATEGGLGWVEISTANGVAVSNQNGLRVKYALTGGTAARGSDYYAAQATLVTGNSFKADNYVLLPQGSTSTKLYISALEDTIHEGTETVNLELQTEALSNDQGFTYQLYNLDTSRKTASVAISDTSNFQPGVVITPADRTGSATIRASLVNGAQQAGMDVHLLSQPRADVTVSLSTSSGSLSKSQLTFTASNWSQPQRVNLNNQRTDQATTVSAKTSSSDSFYAGSANLSSSQRLVPSSWSSELGVSLWEGGALQPALPIASVQAISAKEGGSSDFGFDLSLSQTVVKTGVEVFYTLNPGSGFVLDTSTSSIASNSTADAAVKPPRQYNPATLSADGAYVDLGALNTVGSTGAFSAEAWVRLDATGTTPTVLDFGNSTGNNEILLGFQSGGTVPQLLVFNGSGQQIGTLVGSSALPLGQWSHLAYSIDSDRSARLYVDGNLAASGTLSETLPTGVRTNNAVGRRAGSSSGALRGAVHDVRIWNTSRTADQIQASLLDSSASGSNLVGAYSLNNTTANSVAGAPAAVLHKGASFATTPFYGSVITTGAATTSLRLTTQDDAIAEASEPLTLNILGSSRYNGTGSSGSATASLSDNDQAAVRFFVLSGNGAWIDASTLEVSEGDVANGKFTPLGISLATRPTSTVTITVDTNSFSATDLKVLNSNGSAKAGSLSFTPDNWDQVQQLTLQGVDDSSDDNDSSNLVSVFVTGSDGAYTALSPSITVTTLDNDDSKANESLAQNGSSNAPVASIGAPSLSVLQEGSSSGSTFTVSLSAPAIEDTLLFFDFDPLLSQIDADDVTITGLSNANVLGGLTLLQQQGNQAETSSTDSDGINENGSSFQSKGLSGSFKTTWSGYIRIKESGNYSFKAAVQGGVRLSINGTTVIDKMFDHSSTEFADPLYLEAGSFVPVTLDYSSYGTQEPKISLSWIRPDQGGTTDVEEVIPGNSYARADGLHLIIPKGSSQTTFTLLSVDDKVAEGQSTSVRSEDLVINLLDARGAQIKITAATAVDSTGQSQLSLSLSQTDREAMTLAAGTQLQFGQDLETSSDAVATVTLKQAVTLHRDRTTSAMATVTQPGSSSVYSGSLVNLVSSTGTGIYQVLDPGVDVIAASNWTPSSSGATSGEGQIQLSLGATNRGSITLPTGTTLTYQSSSADGANTPLMTLTLLDPVSLSVAAGASSGPATSVRVSATNYSSAVPQTVPNLVGLSTAYSPAPVAKVSINDNDTPGIVLSSDAAGLVSVNPNTAIQLQETGASVERYLRLSSQPTKTVTVYLESSDRSEGLLQLSGSSADPSTRITFTFSPESWATPQPFRVVPVDDNLIDGTTSYMVKGRTVSSDTFYNIKSTGTALTLSNADNDQAKLKLELVQSTISKGSNGYLSLSLSAEPTAPVTITLTPSDSQFTLNDSSVGRPETLTFSADNWSIPQQVDLVAVDDFAVEDVSRSSLNISTTSSDSRFNALSVDPVTVDVVDNDPPTATIALVNDSSEEAKPGSFRISLSSPAPASAGSTGLVVNYQISSVTVDSGLGYPNDPSTISKITQAPGVVSGSVRIAPGQSSSDSFVIPIDDYVEDSINKSFQVKLSNGAGYLVSSDNSKNTTTVTIVNNDIAGLAIITSGDRVLALEGGSGAQYQIALLTQPTSDVTIDIAESIPNGGARQLGNSSTPFSSRKVFTANNWYIPQVVELSGWDDNKIEDGSGANANTGLHSTNLQYTFTSNDKKYSSSDNSASDHFTHTVQAVDVMDRQLPTSTSTSVNSALTSLQDGLDSLALPMVGSLDGKTGLGIRKFLNDLVNSISAAGTPSPKKLQKLIADGIGIGQDAVAVSMKGSDVEVGFTFKDDYDIFSVPLDSKFGLPGLGLKSEGSLDAGFSYDARVDLVFPLNGEIYLDTDPAKTYFNANYTTSISDDFKLQGGLGFLQLDAVNQASVNEDIIKAKGDDVKTGLDIDFSLDLAGSKGAGADNKLTLSELTSSTTNFEDLFNYKFSGDAALSLGIKTSVNGSAAIPSFSFDLASLLPLFDYSNQDQADDPAAATNFYFDNIKLDLGSYISDMLGPVVNGIDDILNPLYPIVDALYTDTRIFSTIGIEKTFDGNKDGIVSPLDLCQWFADLYASFDPVKGKQLQDAIDVTIDFLDQVKGVMDLIRDLEKMAEQGSFSVDFGSYVLPAYQAGNASSSTEAVMVDDASTQDLSKDTASQADKGGTDASGKSSSSFSSVMKKLDDLGFKIPLIDDPKNVVKALLGQNVDLFTWRMKDMGAESNIEQDFYIYPGIDGIIEGGFGVGATIGFGFDTYGLNQWRDAGFKSSDAWKVFNGFYVADRQDDVDIPEFTLDAFMGAGLGLSAVVTKASVTGGLEAGASFDLMDEGEVAGTDDGKIRGEEITSRIDTPLELFELVGDLAAYLKAKVQVGIDLGFYSIWDTVWEEKLATIPIFEFGVGGSYGSGTASQGYITGGTVFWDGNNNGRLDSVEPHTTTSSADASFKLKLDHRSYDTNKNDKIDLNEGRFVLYGGIDTSTNQPMTMPMVAPFGQMITPLTTLYSMGLDLGYSDKDLRQWMNRSLGLEGFDLLNDDPVLALREQSSGVKGGTVSQRAYLAHIKLNFATQLLTQTLQDLMPTVVPNTLQGELGLLKTFASELLTQKATGNFNQILSTAIRGTASKLAQTLPSTTVGASPTSNIATTKTMVREVGTWSSAIVTTTTTALDKQLTSVRDQSGPAVLNALDTSKSKAYSYYNKATDTLGQGLQALRGQGLVATVQRRLQTIRQNQRSKPLTTASRSGAQLDAISGQTLNVGDRGYRVNRLSVPSRQGLPSSFSPQPLAGSALQGLTLAAEHPANATALFGSNPLSSDDSTLSLVSAPVSSVV